MSRTSPLTSITPLPWRQQGPRVRRWTRTLGIHLTARLTTWLRGLSIFEKVIVANSAIISLDTLVGWWITQHDPETYHYLIDTAFITLAVLIGLAINFALLRAAFAPLHTVMTTIRAVEDGDLDARATASHYDADAAALARAFNSMLDRLARLRDESSGRVLQAQELERRRLALELHDQTGQSLTALSLHVTAIAARLEGESSEAAIQARAQLHRLNALAQHTLCDVQALATQLRPSLLDDVGLVAALRWLAQDGSQRLGAEVRVRLPRTHTANATPDPLDPWDAGEWDVGEEPRLPSEVETALFRIAQESLTNAVRHGRASHIAFVPRRTTRAVSLLVVDNGGGFVPQLAREAQRAGGERRGMGLDGMAERARLVGGRLVIRSRPGRGCAVRVLVPLATVAGEACDSEAASPDAAYPAVRPDVAFPASATERR